MLLSGTDRRKVEDFLLAKASLNIGKGYKVGDAYLGLDVVGEYYGQKEGFESCLIGLALIGEVVAEDYSEIEIGHMTDSRVNSDLNAKIGVEASKHFWNGVMSGWDDHFVGEWHPGKKCRRQWPENKQGYLLGHRVAKKLSVIR